MKVVPRKRLKHANSERRIFTYDLVLTADELESDLIDLLGDKVIDDDGLIVRGTFEVRLSDGYAQHYVLLKGEKEHVERL